MKKRTIIIRDETLRDGLQQPGIQLPCQDRLKLAVLSAELLNTSHCTLNNQIDLGMPETSNKMLTSIKEIVNGLKVFKGIDLFVTGRATKIAIDAMIDSLNKAPYKKRIIAPFLGISQKHRKKLGLTKKDILEKIKETIIYCQQYIKRIHFPLEGGYYAFLEDKKFVFEIFKLLADLQVESVPFCDTVGTALPFTVNGFLSYGAVIKELKRKFPKVGISAHCHNDLGFAVANTIEGLLQGAETADGTFFGIGERAGNTSIQTLLIAISEKEKYLGFKIQANLKKITQVSEKIQKILHLESLDNTPIIGKNAFAHASGIHQDGTLKDKKTYQPFPPGKIGRKNHDIILSSLSGKRGIDFILKKKFNIVLSDEELLMITKVFKEIDFNDNDLEKELLAIIVRLLKKIRS